MFLYHRQRGEDKKQVSTPEWDNECDRSVRTRVRLEDEGGELIDPGVCVSDTG